MAWPAVMGFMSQGTQDLTGGLVNGFWNLRGEHQQSDMANLNAFHNLNAMTYQALLNELQAGRSHEYQKELLGLQAKYNSPAFLAGEARKGGLNPNVLFGKGYSASAGSAPSVSTPSVGLGAAGIAPARPYFDFMPSSIAQIASALNQLASAKKQGVETQQLETMLDKYALEVDLKNQLLELNVQLVKTFGSQEKSSEIIERYAHAYQLTTLGDKDAADKALAEAKIETEREVKGLTAAKRKEAEVLANRADELVRAQIENYRSSSQKNRAEAGLASAQTVTEDTLRGWRKALLGSDKEAQDAARDKLINEAQSIKASMIRDGVPDWYDESEFRDLMKRRIEADVKSREFENTWTGRFLRFMLGPSSNVAAGMLFAIPK